MNIQFPTLSLEESADEMKRFFILSDSAFFRESAHAIISGAGQDSSLPCEILTSETWQDILSESRERESSAETKGTTCICLDLSVSGKNGIEIADLFYEAVPDIPVILHLPYSTFDIFTFYEVTPKNVIAVIDKNSSMERLYVIITEILIGSNFLHPDHFRLSGLLKGDLIFREKEYLSGVGHILSRISTLSSSEEIVFDYLAFGYDDAELSEKLHISANTVRKHIDSIKKKLEEFSRSKLISISAISYMKEPWRKNLKDFNVPEKGSPWRNAPFEQPLGFKEKAETKKRVPMD